MNGNARTGQTWLIGLALICALCFIATQGIRPLFNPDEGRYVDIPQEMLTLEDAALPHLNGVVYLEKPPLQYWLTAASLAAFGSGEWAGRLVLSLAWLGISLLTFRLARSLYGLERAWVAMTVVASALLTELMATLLTLDLSLSFWLLLATTALCEAQASRDQNVARTRHLMLLCYGAMGLATLTKGLIGVVLPGGALLMYTAISRDRALWRHLVLGRGLALYMLIVSPWFLWVEHRHPGALQFLIIHEHFQRYLTTIHERYRPFWYFFALLLPALLPWSIQGARALLSQWRGSNHASGFNAQRLIWSLAIVILFFFSASDSKLPPYILPMMPLVAILISGLHPQSLQADLKYSQGLLLVLGIGLIIYSQLNLVDPMSGDHTRMHHTLQPWGLGCGFGLVMTTVFSLWFSRQRQWLHAYLIVGAGFLLTSTALFHVAAAGLGYRYSVKELLHQVGPLEARAPIYTVQTFDWTLPVYAHRTVIPVQWRGELDYGLGFNEPAGRPDLKSFMDEWKNLPQGYALIPRDVHNRLTQEGLPMRVQATDFDNVWVSRR